MTRSRTLDAGNGYGVARRAGAFLRGALEPLVNVAREGLETEGLSSAQMIAYALRIAESSSSSCYSIKGLIEKLTVPVQSGFGPFRSSANPATIPQNVQDRLCELFRSRYNDAIESISAQQRRESDQSNSLHLSEAKYNSKMEKGRMAYDILQAGAIDSPQARRHLSAVFCDAACELLATKRISGPDAERIYEGILREFNSERIRNILPNGVSPYEASRIISFVSEVLCGADMTMPRR